MGLPDSALTDDEAVVLSFNPHWKTMVKAFFLLAVVIVAAGAAIWVLPDWEYRAESVYVILGVALLALLIGWLVPFLQWFTTKYVLTTRRFVMRRGILSRSGRDVPLNRVNDVAFRQTLPERMLGCGRLVVSSAGEYGQLVLRDIPRVEHVQSELYRLMDEVGDDEG